MCDKADMPAGQSLCFGCRRVPVQVLARLEIELRRAETAEEKYKQAVVELRRRDESDACLCCSRGTTGLI